MINDLTYREDTFDNETRFDRLVDGELSPDEYRALLEGLDHEPAGWRRCALAFLEAQALRADLENLPQSPNVPLETSATGVTSLRGSQKRSPRVPWPPLLAIAASFLAAFCLGVVAPRLFVRGQQDRPLAGNYGSAAGVASVGQQPTSNEPLRHEAFRPVEHVRLVMDGPGGEVVEAAEVPVYEMEHGLEQLFAQDPPALGLDLVELLRRTGHEVERQEQFLPAQLDDGRQVIVPIERYRITPVSRQAY